MKKSKQQKTILSTFPFIWVAWFITGTDFLFGITGGLLVIALLVITYKILKEYGVVANVNKVLVMILLTILVFASSIIVTLKKSAMSKINAINLIVAIENFKNANGRYPNDLISLLPVYIDEIPKSKMGLIFKNDYSYGVDKKGKEYLLSYPNVLFTDVVFTSKNKVWKIAE